MWFRSRTGRRDPLAFLEAIRPNERASGKAISPDACDSADSIWEESVAFLKDLTIVEEL